MSCSMKSLDRRILEEMIYERVRVSVNLCQLVMLEQDLDRSIHKALTAGDATDSEREALARELVDKAWQRIEAEWDELRRDSDLA
jgi:hypothetical protein